MSISLITAFEFILDWQNNNHTTFCTKYTNFPWEECSFAVAGICLSITKYSCICVPWCLSCAFPLFLWHDKKFWHLSAGRSMDWPHAARSINCYLLENWLLLEKMPNSSMKTSQCNCKGCNFMIFTPGIIWNQYLITFHMDLITYNLRW